MEWQEFEVALVLEGFMLANTLYLLVNRLADGLGWRFMGVEIKLQHGDAPLLVRPRSSLIM